MPTSSFPTVTTGVTVQTATNGGLSGDGSAMNKLAVDLSQLTGETPEFAGLGIGTAGEADKIKGAGTSTLEGFATGTFGTSVVTPLITSADSGDLTIDSGSSGSITLSAAAADGDINLNAGGSGFGNVFVTAKDGVSFTVDGDPWQIFGGVFSVSGPITRDSGDLTISTTTSGDVKINTAGNLNLVGLPTSAAGLASGDVWLNSNVLTIVP